MMLLIRENIEHIEKYSYLSATAQHSRYQYLGVFSPGFLNKEFHLEFVLVLLFLLLAVKQTCVQIPLLPPTSSVTLVNNFYYQQLLHQESGYNKKGYFIRLFRGLSDAIRNVLRLATTIIIIIINNCNFSCNILASTSSCCYKSLANSILIPT